MSSSQSGALSPQVVSRIRFLNISQIDAMQDTHHREHVRRYEKKIRLQALDVLEKRKAYKSLHARQETRRNAQKTLSELSKWREQFDIHKLPERSLRIPDRTFPVRMYSRMGDDLWKLPELRGWFQHNAADHSVQCVDVEATRYLVRTTPFTSRPEVAVLQPSITRVDVGNSNVAVHDVKPLTYDPIGAAYVLPKDSTPTHIQGHCRPPRVSKEQLYQRTTTILRNCDRVDLEQSGYLTPQHPQGLVAPVR